MKQLIATVYDQAVGAFMQPFFCRSKSEAIRSFTDAVDKSDTPFCVHPEDYTLFVIGEYDDLSGNIVACLVPEKLITALECRSASG